jgi:hypothetical protein
MPRRHGAVDIVSASRTEDPGLNSAMVTGLLLWKIDLICIVCLLKKDLNETCSVKFAQEEDKLFTFDWEALNKVVAHQLWDLLHPDEVLSDVVKAGRTFVVGLAEVAFRLSGKAQSKD